MKKKKTYDECTLRELKSFLKLKFPLEIGSYYLIQYSGHSHCSSHNKKEKRKGFHEQRCYLTNEIHIPRKVLRLIKYKKGYLSFEDKEGYWTYVIACDSEALLEKVNYINLLIEIQKELGI